LIAAGIMALLLIPALARPASAHPLGNYTVNRAVAVTITPDHVALLYLIDMAEIPAFSEIGVIDVNADGSVSPAEAGAYADAACARALTNLELRVDTMPVRLSVAAAPSLDLLPGAGGLQTLRLACDFTARPSTAGSLTVVDHTDDGHVGWREVTIAAAGGVRISDADVSDRSESDYLRSYPTGRLESPPDVREGRAAFSVIGGAAQTSPNALSAPAGNPRSADPLAALLAGDLSPAVVVLALLLAAGLGAAHALSPGHGKTLVAAYLVGSDGTMRQAVALGLTVAFAHTAGVLLLGVLVLVAGELFLPETVIGWLTIISGALMAILGAGLVWRALAARRADGRNHANHDHHHGHPHSHGRGRSHEHAPAAGRVRLGMRNVAVLGVAGGLVPSASALIVLLAAVTTGRLAFGLALIVAFGLGMAVVLGGLAAVTAFARGWLDQRAFGQGWLVRRTLGLLPAGSGVLVLGIGLVITITALGRMS
ncbi:MAG TPA: nickel transporter, partial [Candidatus Limnocylindria bacterium]